MSGTMSNLKRLAMGRVGSWSSLSTSAVRRIVWRTRQQFASASFLDQHGSALGRLALFSTQLRRIYHQQGVDRSLVSISDSIALHMSYLSAI
jgi:hypothetical protein